MNTEQKFPMLKRRGRDWDIKIRAFALGVFWTTFVVFEALVFAGYSPKNAGGWMWFLFSSWVALWVLLMFQERGPVLVSRKKWQLVGNNLMGGNDE